MGPSHRGHPAPLTSQAPFSLVACRDHHDAADAESCGCPSKGAGASEADAFSAALGSVIEVVKVKAENLSDENASVAAKTLNFSNAADLNLIKTKVTGKTANLAGIDADAVVALIDDTATSIKNVNDDKSSNQKNLF